MAASVHTLQSWLAPRVERIGRQRHLMSIRDGVVSALPLVIVGSVFMLIAYPPVPAWQNWGATRVESYTAVLFAIKATMGLISLVVAFVVAHSLAGRYELDGIGAGVSALIAFGLCALEMQPGAEGQRAMGIAVSWLGPQGIFVAIILAILAAEIHRIFVKRNWVFRLPAGVPDAVLKSFIALAPTFATLALVWLVEHIVLRQVLDVRLFDLIALALAPLLRAFNTLPGALGIVLLDSVVWLFGIHPVALMAPVHAAWLQNLTHNAELVQGGLGGLSLATREFFVWFIWLGGSGVSLVLPFLFWRARSSALRTVARVGLPATIFNINDPIIFGAPLVMNLTLGVPFIVAPLVCTLTTWGALTAGLVRIPYVAVPWTLPAPIGAYLSTGGDWRAIVLMLVNLAIAAVIYLPFVRAYDRALAQQETSAKS